MVVKNYTLLWDAIQDIAAIKAMESEIARYGRTQDLLDQRTQFLRSLWRHYWPFAISSVSVDQITDNKNDRKTLYSEIRRLYDGGANSDDLDKLWDRFNIAQSSPPFRGTYFMSVSCFIHLLIN